MAETLIANAWLIPALPLLGALLTVLTARRLGERCAYPVIAGIGAAFVVSLGLLWNAGPEAKTVVYEWIEAGALKVPVEFRVDGLTTVMLSMVTFVSTLVAVFATGYMAGDPGFPRFFAVVGLFVASMTGLVLSGNYLLTYAFWEGVGVCSYLLIGFWHAKPSAAAAAKKAFLINRVGDVGFAIAIFWMWVVSDNHDLSYEVFLGGANLKVIPYAAIYGISFLLFWAATAKSAQIPLYVWLPDAMEGPTPVSALIHAATMVTAGVYLVARSMPLIALAPLVQMTICLVGALTALLAALIALTQTDLKRVLAYSTVSQLGYMFMGLGAGVGEVAQFALVAGIFHLFTHAFFKALLFLGSGSVMHSMGHVIDMRRFSGLRRRMPITCATFAVGSLALSGIFPFAG
ncbi:MAG: NADH-quinone oxidoreductase subunit L, partial [Thermoleophilia bacterium]|nr:NADH-quinone oxidoreductase subunit L [Thermoleophilia bacterium]